MLIETLLGDSIYLNGGLSIGKFVKALIYQYATKEASLEIARVCERACYYPNMLACGISCRVTINKCWGSSQNGKDY